MWCVCEFQGEFQEFQGIPGTQYLIPQYSTPPRFVRRGAPYRSAAVAAPSMAPWPGACTSSAAIVASAGRLASGMR